MNRLAIFLPLFAVAANAATQVVALPSNFPLVTFRLVFRTGASYDQPGKAGAAALTASMLSDAGSKHRTYKQIVEALYPIAASVSSQTDKEMTVIGGTTHIDNLEAFYGILRELILEPGWRQEDFTRLRDDQVNYLRVALRGNNDEELGKEVLYSEIYAAHPFSHTTAGRVSDLQKMTVADLQEFYKKNFTQNNLTIGIAGGYPKDFVARMQKDFSALPKGSDNVLKLPEPKATSGLRVTMVEKQTRSVAYSLGHPIAVKRGHPDYAALLVAQSYLGQHRNSGGQLYGRMREARGLNYGDYAYIEYFPRGMYQFEPDPNLARQQQIFQVWIRPVEPATAHFALRLAMFELDKLVREGIPEEGFERTRSFLSKYVNLLTKTKSAELGYAIDSRFYSIPEYSEYLKAALTKLTREDVNRAIRKHLRPRDFQIAVIGQNMEALKVKLLANDKSPMTYNSPKPEDILAEDKIVEAYKLPFEADKIRIVPVDQVFE